MRKIAIWVGALSVLTGAHAVNNSSLKPSFADLTWYSNRQAVKAQMQKKGYQFTREVAASGATDVEFSGKIQGIPARILHYFNSNNQLVKTLIVFDKSYNSTLYKNWQDVKYSLDNKYGKGKNLSTLGQYDSTDYDFSLESALNDGKNLQVFGLSILITILLA